MRSLLGQATVWVENRNVLRISQVATGPLIRHSEDPNAEPISLMLSCQLRLGDRREAAQRAAVRDAKRALDLTTSRKGPWYDK